VSPASAANGSTAGDTPATTKTSTRTDNAGDNTPTQPGTEASRASSGVVEHSKHPPGERAEGAAIAVSGSNEDSSK
jgi:hypothetical protein